MEKFPIKISFSKSIGEINEKLEIFVCGNELLQYLSKLACAKVGISYREKYEFINSIKMPLSMINTVESNSINKDTHLILTDPDMENNSEYQHEYTIESYQTLMWKPLAIVAFVLSISGFIALLTIYIISLSSIFTYSVIIDAGSTSSKIYLYYWVSNKYINNADVLQLSMCKADPGISAFSSNPNKSYDGIKNCLDNKIIPLIPTKMRKKTFVYLGATAGMRMLSLNNPNASRQIMSFIRESLIVSPLTVNDSASDVAIITGAQEGLFGWTTVNFLLNNLPKSIVDKPKVIGALDMGGASTQITFLDNSPNNSSKIFKLKLYGNSYSVYSYSYLCYGKSQAETRFLAELVEIGNFTTNISNPCMPESESVTYGTKEIFNVPCVMGKFALDHYGHEVIPPSAWLQTNQNITFKGTNNYTSCNKSVQHLFNMTKCEYKSCSFNGVYQPTVSGKFGAFSAYNLIKTILNKNNENLDFEGYITRMKKLCESKFSGTTETDKWTKWRCFDVVFMIQMLINLGFNEANWNNIEFIDKIGDSNVGWGLGFIIDKTSIIPKEYHFLPIDNYLFGILVAVLFLILCFAVAFTYFFCVKHRRKGLFVNNPNLTEEEKLLS